MVPTTGRISLFCAYRVSSANSSYRGLPLKKRTRREPWTVEPRMQETPARRFSTSKDGHHASAGSRQPAVSGVDAEFGVVEVDSRTVYSSYIPHEFVASWTRT
jgi:hypothetical protein